jgi:dTMP kinase
MFVQKSSTHGKFIVFEGIDGSGTTTQTRLLCRWFQEEYGQNRPDRIWQTAEPTGRPIGKLLREIMGDKILSDEPGGNFWRPPARAMALLFTADRLDHVRNCIEPRLAMGEHVVCDRYLHSTLGYQSLTSQEPTDAIFEWLMTVSKGVPLPDLTIVLNVSPAEAARRRVARDEQPQMYEQDELQIRLADFYCQMPRMGVRGHIEVINGELPEESVAETCRELVRPYVMPWSQP